MKNRKTALIKQQDDSRAKSTTTATTAVTTTESPTRGPLQPQRARAQIQRLEPPPAPQGQQQKRDLRRWGQISSQKACLRILFWSSNLSLLVLTALRTASRLNFFNSLLPWGKKGWGSGRSSAPAALLRRLLSCQQRNRYFYWGGVRGRAKRYRYTITG